MRELPQDAYQMIITSPPYNVGWNYAGRVNDRLPIPDYLRGLEVFLMAAGRVLRPGGVLAVNLPQTIRPERKGSTTDPEEPRSYPLAAWLLLWLENCGWLLREPTVWVKSKGDVEVRATSTAIGAHSNPYLRPCHEMIVIASLGTYRIPGRDSRWPGESKAFGGYLESCKDVWAMRPGRAKDAEPLAFPDELVARLLMLYSNPGDLVLDPYAGNGTVGRVAMLHGRIPTLIEREETYWPRLNAVLGQQSMQMAETYI